MSDSSNTSQPTGHLEKTLGPVMLWGLGVGYVISGEYFGWNLGLPVGGSLGMFLAFLLVTTMYVTFVYSYAEMACAIPRAGGVFVYAGRSLGPAVGYVGGIAQAVEFAFAPPAIALAIGGHTVSWLDADTVLAWNRSVPVSATTALALLALLVFTLLNVWGVRQAALFELAVTLAAVVGLLVFSAAAMPHVRWEHLARNAWPQGWAGMFGSIPFAIWFYLAIEGVANAAEEAVAPQRDISRGFGAAMVTLVILASLAFVCCIGVGGWEGAVYDAANLQVDAGGLTVSPRALERDTPIPLAVAQFAGSGSWLHRLMVAIALLGLVASLNGIILASGRALFEMGRVGFFLRYLGAVHPRTHTPANALLTNFAIGVFAILFCDTGGLITLSAFGAVTLYIIAMLAVMRLRTTEPELARPYRTPAYPWFPCLALVIATVCLSAMCWSNWQTSSLSKNYTLWYLAYVALATVYYSFAVRGRLSASDLHHFRQID